MTDSRLTRAAAESSEAARAAEPDKPYFAIVVPGMDAVERMIQ